MATSTAAFQIRSLRLHGRDIQTLSDLARCILDESNDHVRRTPLTAEAQLEDFQMSCDALNFWRMLLRLQEERFTGNLDDVRQELKELICEQRGYEADEFEFALVATKDRPRSAFGLGRLEQAYLRSQRVLFRLLVSELKDSQIATDIAAIARQLQLEIGNSNILLPIEQLRIVLSRRKIVISGVVRRLVDCGLIRMVNEKYHTRRAREYLFVGEQGKHFEIGQTNEDGN
jgi:hypothetical protein